MGGIGPSRIQGAVLAKASRIIAIDINDEKEEISRQLGATDFINPKNLSVPLVEAIIDMTDGGVDYSFECVGNVSLTEDALDRCHKGW